MSHKTLLVVLFAVGLGGAPAAAQAPRTQVRFAGPSGMQIRWQVVAPDGKASFSEPPLEAPGRFNFVRGATYRLKLSRIAGFPGLELYPTLEVPHAGAAAQQFLAHSAVQLELTAEDFRRAAAGQHVVRTVHLPGVGQGAGPALLILRLGNLDLEGTGTK
jgi:hypothetical protein